MSTDQILPAPRSSLLPLLVDRHGPLTEELVLKPGQFGLGMLPGGIQPQGLTRSVCGFCSTGCGLDVYLRDGGAVGVAPSHGYPVNLGMACPKGWESLAVMQSPDRATTPLLKTASGARMPVDWDTAMRTFVDRMQAIQKAHGPAAIAYLSTGQIVTEEMALLGALAKFGMGMIHGDGNTRQCMATAVTAYKESFGFDAPPFTYADFEQSDVIVLVGSNLCIAHPILWQRVMRNPHAPRIIVLDPRSTETAMAATQHLAVYPKTDLTLLYGIAQLLIERDWVDRRFVAEHTEGFEDFARFVADFTLERVAAETRLPAEAIEQFAETIHQGNRVSFWWTMGVNQSHQGVRTAQAIINLALMTGNIGRPGTGANSVTGQANAMGSRLFSNTTNLLGGRDFTKPEHRAHVAEILGIDAARIPSEPSWPYHRIMEGILSRKIRGLWVVCTNPAHSWINQDQARDILSRLDFLVVQDIYHNTETAQMADLVFPAAGWGEKEGTFINSERRIGRVKKVAKAPGKALADFDICRLVADYWGCGDLFRRWSTPEAVFQDLKRLSAGQPCDFSGIADYAELDRRGGIQWPYPESGPNGERPDDSTERRLFADGRFFRPGGRARFICDPPRPWPEQPNPRFPFILNTGRATAAQWHTQTRTSKSPILRKLYPAEAYVEINPQDARSLGIMPGAWVLVVSQRGYIRVRAFPTPTIQSGQVFIPMHYEVANRLTDAVFDPHSFQPAYKACAVRLEACR